VVSAEFWVAGSFNNLIVFFTQSLQTGGILWTDKQQGQPCETLKGVSK